MKKPRDVALDLWVSTRTAHPHEVKEFAEAVSTDPAFVNSVILEYVKPRQMLAISGRLRDETCLTDLPVHHSSSWLDDLTNSGWHRGEVVRRGSLLLGERGRSAKIGCCPLQRAPANRDRL